MSSLIAAARAQMITMIAELAHAAARSRIWPSPPRSAGWSVAIY
jgi:hypothetical protein